MKNRTKFIIAIVVVLLLFAVYVLKTVDSTVHTQTQLTFPDSTVFFDTTKVEYFGSNDDMGVFYKNSDSSSFAVASFFVYPIAKYNSQTVMSELSRIQSSYENRSEVDSPCLTLQRKVTLLDDARELSGFECQHERFFGGEMQEIVHGELIERLNEAYVLNIKYDYLPHQKNLAEENILNLISLLKLKDS